jgi:CRP/FNR family cyclic AMP-dependent transcriptional regulator
MPVTRVSTTLLRTVPLFADFTDAQLAVLASVVTPRTISRGAMLMAQGDPTDSVYVLVAGRLQVVMSDSEGREVILATLGPGEVVGEMGLVDDSPRSASVIAADHSDLLSITKREFRKCLAEHFDMAINLMRTLVRRLREADRMIGSLALLDVYGRVAHLLIDKAEAVGGKRVITERLTKQDIAKMVGASREMVSRVMKDLQEGGYIEVHGSQIILRDRIALPE